MLTDESFSYYDELVRSIPETIRESVLRELDSEVVAERTEKLQAELNLHQMGGVELAESRTLFLAALRGVQLKKIPVETLATLHILDSAIRTLYTNPMIYLIYQYVDTNNRSLVTTNCLYPISTLKGMPKSVKRFFYQQIIFPNKDIQVSDLPLHMQKPLVRRFFNLTDSEWTLFCNEMNKASKSEQYYHVLNAPKEGCWSSIISQVQRVLKCMRVLDWIVDSVDGFMSENIMVVPSFTMFQTALNCKAYTLKRTPVQLVPTYGYIEAEHYAELKASGKIALALYLPEIEPSARYNVYVGSFRTNIDSHPSETAFCGVIHDVYHAMREMAMSENVAKARFRLASIAKNHPNNKINQNSNTAVDNILIDGELIHSYPPEIDTMFDPERRPTEAQVFGKIFYMHSLKNRLHPNLKRAFIEDMVTNKALWQDQFSLGRADLLIEDQSIYDQIQIGVTFYTYYLKIRSQVELKHDLIENMIKNATIWQEQFDFSKANLSVEDQVIYEEIQTNLSDTSRDLNTLQMISNIGVLSTQPSAYLNSQLLMATLLGDFDIAQIILKNVEKTKFNPLLSKAAQQGYSTFVEVLLSDQSIRDYYLNQIIIRPAFLNDAFIENPIFFNKLRIHRTEIWACLKNPTRFHGSRDRYNMLLKEILDWRQDSNSMLRHPLYILFEQPRNIWGLWGVPTTILDELRGHLDNFQAISYNLAI